MPSYQSSTSTDRQTSGIMTHLAPVPTMPAKVPG